MESRYTRRNRYGDNLGSVKSRIQAREGSKIDDAKDSTKWKEARQKSDARAFRNAEGVRSRMNKFSEKVSASPASNLSPRTVRRDNADKAQSTNGDVNHSPKTDRRANDIETTTKTSRYSRDYRSRKTETNGVEEKINDKTAVKIEETKAVEVETRQPEQEEITKEEIDEKKSNELDDELKSSHSSKSFSDAEDEKSRETETTNSVETIANETSTAIADDKATSPVATAPSDFISAFASPRISRTTAKTGEKTQKVEEVPGTSSRERRVQNRRQEEEEKLSNASEEPSTRRTDKSELRLERLNDTPVDETPSRRRRRTRKALDSKSSADSSLVSTPDCESSPAVRITPEDQESTSKIPDSSTPTLDVQSESPVPEKIETPTDEPSSLPDEENQVADDDEPPFSKLVENEECVRTSENPEVPDTVADDKDSTVKKKVAEETSESVEPEEVSEKQDDASCEIKVTTENSSFSEPASQTEEVQYTIANLDECKDLSILEQMLDAATEYDDRRKIRSAIRALKKAGVVAKPKDSSSTSSKWQSKTTKTEVTTKSNGSTRTATTTITTTKREVKETRVQKSGLSPLNGEKENKSPPSDPKSLAEKYGLTSETKKDKAGSKKVGSIFDREEETPRKSGSRLDFERRQAERKREMMRNRAPPSSAASKDARKKFVAQLEDESGTPKDSNGVKSMKSPTSVVPNANNVKNMLLRWCKAKTRGYEHVDISNYSSSWKDGMAFCALIHNFFPDAFDYSTLEPCNKEHNFKLAFDTAERRGEIPPLLDVTDLVRMDEPDWKCIYTYLTEFYKHIRELGMT